MPTSKSMLISISFIFFVGLTFGPIASSDTDDTDSIIVTVNLPRCGSFSFSTTDIFFQVTHYDLNPAHTDDFFQSGVDFSVMVNYDATIKCPKGITLYHEDDENQEAPVRVGMYYTIDPNTQPDPIGEYWCFDISPGVLEGMRLSLHITYDWTYNDKPGNYNGDIIVELDPDPEQWD